MTLLSLASRQIWPQVLAVLHFQPHRLILLHSGEATESLQPAERLRSFFESTGRLPGGVLLRQVPHDSFSGLEQGLADVADSELLDEANCQLNLTGGNKLMAMAAAEWARLANVPCFYLERDLRVFPFSTEQGNLKPGTPFPIDPHLARDLDPVDLLRCQLNAAEIVDPGERLTLSEAGRRLDDSGVRSALGRGTVVDPSPWLVRTGPPVRAKPRVGDHLETLTALVLLHLGVPRVQRGIRLRSGSGRSHWQDEGELDLVFNWAGKLWVVDCKHRRTAESRMASLKRAVEAMGPVSLEVSDQLDRVTEELRDKELKPLKEDLLTVSEVGGLLGRAVAVRVEILPGEAVEFARSRNLPVVLRSDLCDGLRALLHPDRPASLESLRQLARAHTRASA